jgi:DNA-binding MurR/RpiR family transcriptional regulator
MSVRDLIRQRFSELSPALAKVARFVLDRPSDVVTVSMRTISLRSDTKPTTLVRFAQHFGFSGWPQLKEAFALELGLGPKQQYGQRARGLLGRAKDQTLVAEMFRTHRYNLETTERQNEHSLQRACALLEKANAVHVAGFRSCFPVALSFVYVYRLFRQQVHLADGQGGSLEMQLNSMEKADALLVISFTPYSREALQAARAAKAAGCRIVAMTDSAASPISLIADETILFAIESPSFFPSVTAAIALTESLLELLASRAGRAGVKRIHQIENELFKSGAYVDPLTAPK